VNFVVSLIEIVNNVLNKKFGTEEETGDLDFRLLVDLIYSNEMDKMVEHIVKSKKLTYKEKFKRLKKTYLTLHIDNSGKITKSLRVGMILRLRDLYEDERIKIAGRLYNALINDKDILEKAKNEGWDFPNKNEVV